MRKKLNLKILFKYIFIWLLFCVALFYLVLSYCDFMLSHLMSAAYGGFAEFFIITCVLGYVLGIASSFVYGVKRYRLKVGLTYPTLDFTKPVNLSFGHLYSSNGKTYLDTDLVVFEINSSEDVEVKHGADFLPASVQDMNAPKSQKLYARLKQ